jgi:hypothetical protein
LSTRKFIRITWRRKRGEFTEETFEPRDRAFPPRDVETGDKISGEDMTLLLLFGKQKLLISENNKI